MIGNSLQDFINFASDYLTKASPSESSREALLARLAKLNEEVGELNGAVLAHLGDQRKEKLAEYNETQLSYEIVDVIICVLLIAKLLNLDVDKACVEKTTKIRKRFAEGIR